MGYLVAPLNCASNRVAPENGVPDLDTGVIDLCRRTPRKWKSTTRPFRHMTSMPPNTVPRRTQDNGKQTDLAHLSSPIHMSSTQLHTRSSYVVGSGIPDYRFGPCDGHHEMVDFRLKEACTCFTSPIDARCK